MGGQGPPPPAATNALRDARLEDLEEAFYWDEHGRRHRRPEEVVNNKKTFRGLDGVFKKMKELGETEFVDVYDLRKCFKSFDSAEALDDDAEGTLSMDQFENAVKSLGVPLQEEEASALCRHFDPNGSGAINYGEFLYAFFNRRALLNKVYGPRGYQDDVFDRIAALFHKYDKTGDGDMGPWEFRRMARALGLHRTLGLDDEGALEEFRRQFDHDGDGTINAREFLMTMYHEYHDLVIRGRDDPRSWRRPGADGGNGGSRRAEEEEGKGGVMKGRGTGRGGRGGSRHERQPGKDAMVGQEEEGAKRIAAGIGGGSNPWGGVTKPVSSSRPEQQGVVANQSFGRDMVPFSPSSWQLKSPQMRESANHRVAESQGGQHEQEKEEKCKLLAAKDILEDDMPGLKGIEGLLEETFTKQAFIENSLKEYFQDL